MDKRTQPSLWYPIPALLAVLMIQTWWTTVCEVTVYHVMGHVLDKATDIARNMVTRVGMSDELPKLDLPARQAVRSAGASA